MIPAMTNPTTVPVRGRDVEIKDLTDAQLLLLAREARLARNPDTESERKFTAVARIMDILETAIVKGEDKEYVLDLTVAGTLEMKDLLGFISVAEQAEDAPKPRARRGRPPTKRA